MEIEHNKFKLYYACCPFCKTILVQAQNGMDGYIKCPKCDNYIHIKSLYPTKTFILYFHNFVMLGIGAFLRFAQAFSIWETVAPEQINTVLRVEI